ncbi:hypothetical protein PITCH_A1580073 [uncultured Desulfobacterium sp.]|uniref:Uncharacterized protein n=1 Tax=uncultured Desulfobacterium sp. TaxID=201089 RepID=A0A445MTY0_9BACT|nr:hypothetical protein PITCH_A1580073 [uncultured Desulfobacterium sp.]
MDHLFRLNITKKEAAKWKAIINTVIITNMSTLTPTNTRMATTERNIAMNTATPMRMAMTTNTVTATATKETDMIMNTDMEVNMVRTITTIRVIKRNRMIIATNKGQVL